MSDETPGSYDDTTGRAGAQRPILMVLPSAWFATAHVIVLDRCHHRHVRPITQGHKVGDMFDCCYCGDGEPMR